MSANEGSGTEIVDYDNLDADTKKIIKEAIEARKASYSPYSKFAVGACLQCDDGSLYKGCNIEHAVLSLTICAERTAIAKAISEGKKHFKSIAVIGQQEDSFTTPCGPCRQFMAEFNKKIIVYVTKPTLGKVLVSTAEELLPYGFGF